MQADRGVLHIRQQSATLGFDASSSQSTCPSPCRNSSFAFPRCPLHMWSAVPRHTLLCVQSRRSCRSGCHWKRPVWSWSIPSLQTRWPTSLQFPRAPSTLLGRSMASVIWRRRWRELACLIHHRVPSLGHTSMIRELPHEQFPAICSKRIPRVSLIKASGNNLNLKACLHDVENSSRFCSEYAISASASFHRLRSRGP